MTITTTTASSTDNLVTHHPCPRWCSVDHEALGSGPRPAPGGARRLGGGAVSIKAQETTLLIVPGATPARELPNGLWIDVHAVLLAHGVTPPPLEVLLAVHRLLDVTPVGGGGRLRPDGTLERSETTSDLTLAEARQPRDTLTSLLETAEAGQR